jgi:hypothetical protein
VQNQIGGWLWFGGVAFGSALVSGFLTSIAKEAQMAQLVEEAEDALAETHTKVLQAFDRVIELARIVGSQK